MITAVQTKIDSIKALSQKGIAIKAAPKLKNKPRITNDSLSKAIRSSRDAAIFRQELKIALSTPKK